MTKISVVGAGYVGIVSACCYAEKGNAVIICEVDSARRKMIQDGSAPFHEPSLDESLKSAASSGRLTVTDSVRDAVIGSDVTFITVGTPSKKDGRIDLTQTRSASKGIGVALKEKNGYHYVVVRSTVVPGATSRVLRPILEKASDKQVGEGFGLAVNPEFLEEGSAFEDTFHPDRIVIGELDVKTGDFLQEFYVKFHDSKPPPILRMSSSSAEMVKYASNAFLAMKISFINEIANISEKIPGVDVVRVADGVGLDTRIGRKFLNAGLGFGGSCFSKDVRALIAASERLGYRPSLVNSVLERNETQAGRAVELAVDELGSLKRRRVAVLGLSFKPETDDMREARSIVLIHRLLKLGAKVTAYDPVAGKNAESIFHERIDYAKSVLDCIDGADCCIIVTEWDEFRKLTPDDFLSHMKRPVVIDGRRIYDPNTFVKKLRYRAIGLAYSKRE
jgi:UDPglucose 6-dehydrogenase